MTRRSDDSEDGTADTTDSTTTSHVASTWKVLGELDDAGATGVLGHNTATSGAGSGVEGVTDAVGYGTSGVSGLANASTGVTYGVAGYNNSTASLSAAVFGRVTADSNANETSGVYGKDPTENGAGVLGESAVSTGTAYGVYGTVGSSDGYGVYSFGDSKTVGEHEVEGRLLTHDDIDGSETDPSTHVAHVRNDTTGTAMGLAITFPNKSTEPNAVQNFVSFRSGGSNNGSIEGNNSGGVQYETSGADYAEYMPRLDPDDEIEAADVVAVVGDAITRDTTDAVRALAVTGEPAVTGHSPGQSEEDRERYETVAFTGRIPVKVRGPVDEGDLIVPSGEHDGTGVAVAPAEWQPGSPIVGQAWEGDNAGGVSEVTVAVGIDDPAVIGEVLARKDDRIEKLEERLEIMEERLASFESGPTSMGSADD